MSVDGNKAIVRRYVELMNREDWAEHVGEFAPSTAQAEAWNEQHSVFRVAFPDYQFTIDDLLAEADKVVVRGTVRATHKREYPAGEMKGIAPTGKSLEWAEVWIVRIVDGKLADGWLLVDGISRLQQLGILPLPE